MQCLKLTGLALLVAAMATLIGGSSLPCPANAQGGCAADCRGSSFVRLHRCREAHGGARARPGHLQPRPEAGHRPRLDHRHGRTR